MKNKDSRGWGEINYMPLYVWRQVGFHHETRLSEQREVINVHIIAGHQSFPPATFLTPLVVLPEIRLSRWKCILTRIPEKKSFSVIMRPVFYGRVRVSIHSFLERRGFLSFTLQLKSKPTFPACLPSPLALSFSSALWPPANINLLPSASFLGLQSSRLPVHPSLAKVISSRLA